MLTLPIYMGFVKGYTCFPSATEEIRSIVALYSDPHGSLAGSGLKPAGWRRQKLPLQKICPEGAELLQGCSASCAFYPDPGVRRIICPRT